MPWTGDYVFFSGNLILDLLHNFFLENGARTQKLRVYEMTTNPAARTMLGYLFVRGGVHALAYARALETLTGVEMSKMLPIPNIGNAVFPEARRQKPVDRIRNDFCQPDRDAANASGLFVAANRKKVFPQRGFAKEHPSRKGASAHQQHRNGQQPDPFGDDGPEPLRQAHDRVAVGVNQRQGTE
jgi:Mn-containing catalase